MVKSVYKRASCRISLPWRSATQVVCGQKKSSRSPMAYRCTKGLLRQNASTSFFACKHTTSAKVHSLSKVAPERRVSPARQSVTHFAFREMRDTLTCPLHALIGQHFSGHWLAALVSRYSEAMAVAVIVRDKELVLSVVAIHDLTY